MTVRVALADDHPMYLFGLRAVLEQSESVEVVASVGDGEELLRAVSEHTPDVVITDLSMPDLDGVEATRLLLEARPDVAVLVLTMHEDDEHVFAALRAGARGYLVKGAGGQEILHAVLAVASGDAVYGGAVARRIVAFFAGEAQESPTARAFPTLTPREREVLEQLATGRRNHEIARALGLSDKTVRNHLSNLYRKLGVRSRAEAIVQAHRQAS
jgi:DNA-binding NarL/FixJ family response regulator